MNSTTVLEPTLAGLHAKVLALQAPRFVQNYARTRNDLNGGVTQLSPYVTHGFTDTPALLRTLRAHHAVGFDDKIVFEFAWRAFFQHVWAHQGEGILHDLGAPVFAGDYASEMPQDIVTATTGVPAIDCAVRALYATGYFHNHARIWLASYVVHLRKISWRVGADWLYAHLLDGDLASNHLSWQWVAGTFASKPYLFNAENVARFAPLSTHADWRSEGSVIDQSYEALEAWARSDRRAKAPPGQRAACAVPAVHGVPAGWGDAALPELQGQTVHLVHPWSLAEPPQGSVVVAWLCPEFHAAHPWSAPRWAWVLARMNALASVRVVGGAQQLGAALRSAARVQMQVTPHRAYRVAFAAAAVENPHFVRLPAAQWLPTVEKPCRSFMSYYQAARKQAKDLESCL